MSLRVKLEALTASMEAAGGVGRPTADGVVAQLVSEEERARPLKVGDLALRSRCLPTAEREPPRLNS